MALFGVKTWTTEYAAKLPKTFWHIDLEENEEYNTNNKVRNELVTGK